MYPSAVGVVGSPGVPHRRRRVEQVAGVHGRRGDDLTDQLQQCVVPDRATERPPRSAACSRRPRSPAPDAAAGDHDAEQADDDAACTRARVRPIASASFARCGPSVPRIVERPYVVWFNPACVGSGSASIARRWRSACRQPGAAPMPHAAAPSGAPAFVEESRRASTIATPATSSTSSAAASPPSTATTTGAATCTSPAAASRRRCYRNDSEPGGALRFTPLPSPDTDLTGGHRRLSARHRRRRQHRPRRRSASARTSSCAGSVTAGSSEPTRRSASTAATPGRSPSAPRGRATTRCRRWRSATTSTADREGCEDSRLLRPDAAGERLRRRRSPCHPATARCRCCSATGADRASATCG